MFCSSSSCAAICVGVERAATLREVEAEQVERGHLGDERLRRRDGDLGAGVDVEHRIRLARDGRALRVADRQRAGALLFGVLDRHQGVHGLARLADRDDEGASASAPGRGSGTRATARPSTGTRDQVSIAYLPEHAGVRGGAAGDDDDAVDVVEHVARCRRARAGSTRPSCTRPSSVLPTASGSSLISFFMKDGQPPFSAADASHVDLELAGRHRVAGEVGDLDASRGGW